MQHIHQVHFKGLTRTNKQNILQIHFNLQQPTNHLIPTFHNTLTTVILFFYCFLKISNSMKFKVKGLSLFQTPFLHLKTSSIATSLCLHLPRFSLYLTILMYAQAKKKNLMQLLKIKIRDYSLNWPSHS